MRLGVLLCLAHAPLVAHAESANQKACEAPLKTCREGSDKAFCKIFRADSPETSEGVERFLMGLTDLGPEVREQFICARLLGPKTVTVTAKSRGAGLSDRADLGLDDPEYNGSSSTWHISYRDGTPPPIQKLMDKRAEGGRYAMNLESPAITYAVKGMVTRADADYGRPWNRKLNRRTDVLSLVSHNVWLENAELISVIVHTNPPMPLDAYLRDLSKRIEARINEKFTVGLPSEEVHPTPSKPPVKKPPPEAADARREPARTKQPANAAADDAPEDGAGCTAGAQPTGMTQLGWALMLALAGFGATRRRAK